MDYIREAKGPFIAHLSILRPHPPFVAPEPYNALYDPMAVPGFSRLKTPDEEALQHPWLAHQLSRREYRATANEKKLRRLKAVYYGLMSEVDAALGRLFAFLKATGLRPKRTSVQAPWQKDYASHCTSWALCTTTWFTGRRLDSFTPCAFRGGLLPGCSNRQSFLSLQA